MAGDWIKIRIDLIDDPDVFVMSHYLNIECRTVVGHLLAFWSWIDRHTVDGKQLKLTESMIDSRIGVPDFAKTLKNVGWLSGENMALEIPNFDRHNGNSAKARALESEAKRIRREIKKTANIVGQLSDIKAPESQTREEKSSIYIIENFKPSTETLNYLKARNQKTPTESDIVAFISNKDKKHFDDDRGAQVAFRGWMANATMFSNKNDKSGAATKKSEVKPWFETKRGIIDKGVEFNIIECSYDHFHLFRTAVFKAAGHVG